MERCIKRTLTVRNRRWDQQRDGNVYNALISKSGKQQINGWFVVPIHVEEAVIWGNEMRACTQKRNNTGIGVIIEENAVQIGLIIAEILLFIKCDDLDLHLQGQLL